MVKQKFLPIVAIIILLIGIAATIYVNSNQVDSTVININGEEFSLDQLLKLGEERSIEPESGGLESGIALDYLITYIEISKPESMKYTLIGADGYQKTVMWTNMQNGILTNKGDAVFSDLPKAFNVKEIVEIKVE